MTTPVIVSTPMGPTVTAPSGRSYRLDVMSPDAWIGWLRDRGERLSHEDDIDVLLDARNELAREGAA